MPRLLTLSRGLLPALAVGLVTLAVVPGLEAPFSLPKRVVLAAAAAVALALLPWARQRWRWAFSLPLLSALASSWPGDFTSPTAVGTQVAFGVLLFAWASTSLNPRWVIPAVVGSAALAGAVALAQAVGVDPLASWSPELHGERLHVYSTLGNPDFVASVLGVALPLALSSLSPEGGEGRGEGKTGWPYLFATVLLVGGLAVTRSFATIGALAAGATMALLHRRRTPLPRKPLVLTGAIALLLLLPLVGRSFTNAAQGRRYLWQVALPHLTEAPLLGLGPGAVEGLWPLWEWDFWRVRCGEDARCVAAHPQSRFAGLQDHLHNDWLELAVERGLLGLLSFIVVLALSLKAAWGHHGPRATALVAGLGVLSARAAVDFPLARPADLCLFAAIVGLTFSSEDL